MKFALLPIGLIFLNSCRTVPEQVETTTLSAAIIAAAKEAKAAGASKLTYEATVTTTKKGEASVVIPIGVVTPTVGGSIERAVGSTVTVEVDIKTASQKKKVSDPYLFNTRTFKTTRLQTVPESLLKISPPESPTQ